MRHRQPANGCKKRGEKVINTSLRPHNDISNVRGPLQHGEDDLLCGAWAGNQKSNQKYAWLQVKKVYTHGWIISPLSLETIVSMQVESAQWMRYNRVMAVVMKVRKEKRVEWSGTMFGPKKCQ